LICPVMTTGSYDSIEQRARWMVMAVDNLLALSGPAGDRRGRSELDIVGVGHDRGPRCQPSNTGRGPPQRGFRHHQDAPESPPRAPYPCLHFRGLRESQRAVKPPSTNRQVPVTYEASSDARNSTHAATSWGVPGRLSMVRALDSAR